MFISKTVMCEVPVKVALSLISWLREGNPSLFRPWMPNRCEYNSVDILQYVVA